jgi:PAS domain S-box-containing protein
MARILIVDDELSVRLLLQASLPPLGYEVAGVAVNGSEAFELAKFLIPDIVLMDIGMPGEIDGIEAAKKIRSELAIPVIFLTGYGDDELINRAKCADPFGFLIKPCSEEGLKAAIELALHRKSQERRLNDVLSSYREVTEAVPHTFWLSTGDYSRILYVSPSYEKMWGRSCEELLKNPLDHLAAVHPDELQYVLEKIETQKQGEVTEKVFRIVLPDGSLRWLKDCAFPIKDERGKVARIAGISEDITDRMRAEETLRASERFATETVDALSENIAILDEEGLILTVNESWRDFARKNASSLDGLIEGANYLEVCSHARGAGADQAAEFAEGIRSVMCGEREIFILEYSCHSPWEKRWFLGRVTRFRGEGPVRIVVAHQNITKRKRAEEALRESVERYRMIFNHSPLGIVHFDSNGIIRDFNEKFAQIMGASRQEILGFNMPERLRDPAMRQAVRDALDGQVGYYEGEYLSVTGGKATPMRAIYQRITDEDGKILGALGLFEDVADRKRAEEEREKLEAHLRQAQKMEAIGTLAGGIAHDFNNVLSAIVGFTELSMGKAPENSPLQADLQQVLVASERAKDLVKQILTFSRQSEQEVKPVRIGPLLKEVLKFLRSSIPSTIAIRQHLRTPSESAVLADPTQIHQVIMNLCTNASYAMRQHGGTLEVELSEIVIRENDDPTSYPELNPGPYLSLRVSDTGCGMDEGTMQRIFDPFFTTKPREEGTGMGLAVVYGIVESCGGAIMVRSAPGEGSHFHLYFPKEPSPVPQPLSDPQEVSGGKGRILFVDDEAALAGLAEKTLKGLGYTVVAETSSRKALATFRAQPEQFDLLITDYTMPQLTGLQLIEEIRRIRADMPVILCSGYTDFLDRMNISDLGIQELIHKPISRRTIAAAVRRLLPQK